MVFLAWAIPMAIDTELLAPPEIARDPPPASEIMSEISMAVISILPLPVTIA